MAMKDKKNKQEKQFFAFFFLAIIILMGILFVVTSVCVYQLILADVN